MHNIKLCVRDDPPNSDFNIMKQCVSTKRNFGMSF